MPSAIIPNPLVSTNPSQSGLNINLHPLALLTISDYITRHTLRGGKGPIIGALLGTQNGREISIEHAYELKLVDGSIPAPRSGDGMDIEEEQEYAKVDSHYFETKLAEFKEVHPTLDFVGHFTLCPPPPNHTPTLQHLQTQTHLLAYNESSIFLVFHPSPLASTAGGKLPLTVWESSYEEDTKLDGGKGGELKMKFVELPYNIETGEAEMIAVSYVAAGTGNAGDDGGNVAVAKTTTKEEPKVKGKGKGKEKEFVKTEAEEDAAIELPVQTQELLGNLSAKSGAINMLNSRLNLLLSYLHTVQSDPSAPKNHELLRNINALLIRFSLVEPHGALQALKREELMEQSDVALVALMGLMTKNLSVMEGVGHKVGKS